jgi:hypothetical protein
MSMRVIMESRIRVILEAHFLIGEEVLQEISGLQASGFDAQESHEYESAGDLDGDELAAQNLGDAVLVEACSFVAGHEQEFSRRWFVLAAGRVERCG